MRAAAGGGSGSKSGICFSFRKGDADDVEIVDCRRGYLPLVVPP